MTALVTVSREAGATLAQVAAAVGVAPSTVRRRWPDLPEKGDGSGEDGEAALLRSLADAGDYRRMRATLEGPSGVIAARAARARRLGCTWPEIAEALGTDESTARQVVESYTPDRPPSTLSLFAAPVEPDDTGAAKSGCTGSPSSGAVPADDTAQADEWDGGWAAYPEMFGAYAYVDEGMFYAGM